MSIQITPFFQGRWQVFWATTYTFDPRVFDEFWLPRLGDLPLNVTILVDFDRLARIWSEVSADERWRLRRVNRDYLVRGVRVTDGAFHPKTYFFANSHEGVLLVGSGNLGLDGLEDGHEMFCRFHSKDAQGLNAIQGWAAWMDRLVKRVDDYLVTARWLDVRSRAGWLSGPAEPSLFVSNWDRPLLNQVADAFTAPVDELHVLAPFFDAKAQALHRLIALAQPRHVHVYVGRDTSVHGENLIAVLRGSGAEAAVRGFEPDRFVHAKLIGIVSGDEGWLLSGSANLSLAALTRTAASGTGNVEAGVLLRTTSEIVRSAFVPGRLQVIDRPLNSLVDLRYTKPEEPVPAPLALLSATRQPDHCVRVSYTGQCHMPLFLGAFVGRQPLQDGVTIEPFLEDEDVTLVWLADAAGAPLSNSVPLDDIARLKQCLQERSESGDRPREIDEQDLQTPVGKMLQRLHRACIFDIADTSAVQRAQAAAEETDDPTFWDRLVQEDLRLDPRFHQYQRLGHAGPDDEDDVFALLRLMLDRTPQPAAFHPVRDGSEDGVDNIRTGKPWSVSRRLQVRLYHVLERWSQAISDPRHRWIDVLAPVRNYTALLGAIAECVAESHLDRDHIVRLLGTLFGNFIRTERGKGYLFSLTDAERRQAIAELSPSVQSLAAALAYIALQPSAKWREYLFSWQSFLAPALELGIMRATEDVTTWIGLLVGKPVAAEEIAKRLTWAARYIDDPHWCAMMQRDLSLPKLAFKVEKMYGGYAATLHIDGVPEPFTDSRLVTLVREALAYRKVNGLLLALPNGRMNVQIGETFVARINRIEYESTQIVTHQLMEALEAAGAGWGAMLPTMIESAS
jgi:hypothetical protein